MILNEDYFKDLEIEDEDVIEDDINDVDEPKQELTLEEAQKLPDQYEQVIEFEINGDNDSDIDTTFIQTSLLPRITKRLDAIFEYYGIEHSQYVLVSCYDLKDCETVVKVGDYQLFCKEYEKYENETYEWFFIQVFVNYPNFNYKRAFRFIYTVINLYRIDKQITQMNFKPITINVLNMELNLQFKTYIQFRYFNIINHIGTELKINLDMGLTEKDKRDFYYAVFCHLLGGKVKNIDYEAIDRDVPITLIRPR